MINGAKKIELATELGWYVSDINRDRCQVKHREVQGEYIEIWVDGDWKHVKEQSGFGPAILWDSMAVGPAPRQFVPYLKRLVRGAIKEDLRARIACHQTPKERTLPYPWCIGAPTKQDCLNAGYCRRDPNCGE